MKITNMAIHDIKKYEPYPTGNAQYSFDFCESNKVIKLDEQEDEVLVALATDHSPDVFSLLAQYHKKSIQGVSVENSVFSSLLGKIFSMTDMGDIETSNDTNRFNLDSWEGDAPIINFINSLLIDAINSNASDVHFECFSGYGQVRFRIDGSLTTITRFPQEKFNSVSSRLKIMANLNIMEKRLPQDGRVSVDIDAYKMDLRISIVPIARGESIVLRLLGRSDVSRDFESLGMNESMRLATNKMLAYPHGLLLVTGPTGSGKTTTLNAMLSKIQSDAVKIVTIEDPVEYLIDGIDQIQVNEQINLGFDTLLRRVLRQDPNIIMVGEIRDEPTAELVVRAALTGHLVLTTLHTNDSVSAISRLINIGIEPFLVSAVLKGVIAQRLVRRLCKHCSYQDTATPSEKAVFETYSVKKVDKIYRAGGCEKCNNTGYKGRFALYEHFLMDETLEEMIIKKEKTSVVRKYLIKMGMQSLVSAGLACALSGETTLEELEKEVEL